jgi:hypothetical protein
VEPFQILCQTTAPFGANSTMKTRGLGWPNSSAAKLSVVPTA